MSRNYTNNSNTSSVFMLARRKKPKGRSNANYLAMALLLIVFFVLMRQTEVRVDQVEVDITNKVLAGEFTK